MADPDYSTIQALIDQQGHAFQNTGTITLPTPGGPHAYRFVTGGGGRGAAPLGSYNVGDFAQGGNLGDRWTLTEQGQPYDTAWDPDINAQRSLLRIHEAHGSGTLGCIGILGGQPVYADFEKDLMYVMDQNGGKTTLNLNSPGGQAVASNMAPPPPNAPSISHTSVRAAPEGAAPAQGSIMLSQSNPFISALGNIESGWRNIPSTIDKDYPGQPGSKSQGYLQIDTPTWLQYAKQAGVTAPNAMAASPEDQIKVASLIPIGRFGGITQDKLHKQFGDFDKSATVGELAAKFGGGTNAPATAVASNAPAASAAAAPTTTAPAPAAAASQPAAAAPQPSQYQNFTAAAQKGDVGGMLGALGSGTDEKGNTTTGLIGDMAKTYAKAQQQNPLQTPSIPQAPPMMQNAPAAQALMGQILAQSAKPLSWSSKPYGADLAGPQAPPGMSLTSTSYPETYPYG